MTGGVVEDHGTGGSSSCIEGMSNEQRCHSADSLAEWRSCEQVENGTPSTSPPYWDTDDDDGGAKPADLYGKFTWKIENFSQLNKRELKSNAFEVGGYKWYILIYPQGCDVSNHLSLFLCVFNHEKLLPGWSHFAQFTIAVVNKDPKKSKYSDTLHRFLKKEHDWGWKKFMELSKVSEGFINADTLVIKAQVQVVREKAHRPFRCLDRHYRRELVRVYLSNVEQICRRFVEERRDKLGKLIADKTRWASFRAFWLGIDQTTKRRMSRDKADTILKVAVKHFFIEKEVTSTLVMDSLYSGLKALEYQSMYKNKNGGGKLVDMEELPVPLVHFEKDMFVLADDVLLLLERVALELLPQQPSPPKDDKGSQSRTKDGSSGEDLIKDSIERDERRLTELGRRTIEIFVLAHIFSRIEVAYQEDVALKRQEELIREEEAWQVENELKAKRGAAEKEKRTKKKQAKQKRNTRKGKDRGRDDKLDVMEQDKQHLESAPDRRLLEELSSMQAQPALEKSETFVEASDMSDAGDDVPEARQPELDDRDTEYINWDTDLSEIRPTVESGGSVKQNGHVEKGSPSMIDDSCSTCSTDSVPSVVTNGPYKVNSLPYNRSRTSPAKVKDQRSRDTHDRISFTQGGNSQSYSTADTCEETGNSRDSRPEPETLICLKDRIKRHGQLLAEKEEQPATVPMKLNGKDQIEVERRHQSSTAEPSSSPFIFVKKPLFGSQLLKQPLESTATTVTTAGIASSKDVLSLSLSKTEKSLPLQVPTTSNCETLKLTVSSKSTVAYPLLALSRPLSAPLIPSQRPAAPVVSTVPITPLLSRSVSAVGRLGTADPSPSAPSFVPQSYRNAIVGKSSIGTSTTVFAPLGSSPTLSHPPPILSSSSLLPPQSPAKNALRYGLTFGTITAEAMHSQPVWREDRYSHQEVSSSNGPHMSNLEHDISRTTINGISRAEASSSIPSTQGQGATMSDDFPHLAIINDLLDEDQGIGKAANGYRHSFNRQYTFPRDTSTADLASPGGLSRLNRTEHYYEEGFYGYSNGPLHALRDAALFGQMEHPVYANGVIPNRWPYHHADLPMLNLSTVDANGYSYQLQEYLNSAENGYGVYRSANGL